MTTTDKTKSKKKLSATPRASGKEPTPKAQRGARGAAKPEKTPKEPTKADQLVAMLQTLAGASIAEITGAMGILPHTARAVISVQSRKRGLTVVREDGRYRLTE